MFRILMKKSLVYCFFVVLFFSCQGEKNNSGNTSSSWDNTRWTFTITMQAAEGEDADFTAVSPIPEGMNLMVIDAASGNYFCDWSVMDKMELRSNGDLYFPIQKTATIPAIEDVGETKMTYSGYCLITRTAENEAVGDFEMSSTVENDEMTEQYGGAITMKMKGYLNGTRIK